ACKWDVIIPFEPLWDIYYKVLRPNGFIVLTASQPFTSKLVSSNMDNFSHNWVWNKKRGVGHLLANKRPMMASEDVLVFSNEHSHDFTFNSPLRKYAIQLFKYIGKTKNQIFKDMGNQSVCHFMRTDSTQFNLCTERCYNDLLRLYAINKMNGFIDFEKLKIDNIEWLNKFPRVYNPQMRERESPRISKMKATENSCYGNLNDYKGELLEEKYPINIIEFDKSGHSNMLLHPTQKPVALFEYLIKTYTNEGETVLDNCAGSGTTAIACLNTNRNYILMEKEQKYFEMIENRIAKWHSEREPKGLFKKAI
ncbi:MAG: site-specific DNA-methyltransferase, partial [Bacteroidales bacterium]|nr:site-specific DNA-methyltransferase [Bacteroidales bacterium]